METIVIDLNKWLAWTSVFCRRVHSTPLRYFSFKIIGKLQEAKKNDEEEDETERRTNRDEFSFIEKLKT